MPKVCDDCGSSRGIALCQGDLMLCRECDLKRNTKSAVETMSQSRKEDGTSAKEMTARSKTQGERTHLTLKSQDVSVGTARITYPPVINELLCFVDTKSDLIPRDDLVKLCTDFYSDDDIWHAKQTLYEACTEVLKERNIRMVVRKGPDRNKNNMADICTAMSFLKQDELPVFVAKDLNRLPPITTEHIDTSVLLREIVAIKKGMGNICNQASEIESLRAEVLELKKMITNQEQEKKDMPNTEHDDGKVEPITRPEKTYASVARFSNNRPTEISNESTTVDMSMQSIRQEGNRQEKRVVNESKAKPLVIGQNSTQRLKVNRKRVMKIFVSRLQPETTENELQKYLKEDFGLDSKCTKLKTRYDSYASFKIDIMCDPTFDVYSPKIWPKGLLVKRFFENNSPRAD